MSSQSKEAFPPIVKLAIELQEYSCRPPRSKKKKIHLAETCLEFAKLYVKRVKFFKNSEEENTFTTVLAEDLYMRIFKCKPIHNMIGYTRLSLPETICNWINLYNPGSDTARKMKDAMYQPGALSRCTSSESYLTLDRLGVIELLKNLFDDVHKCIRYSTQWSDRLAKLNAHTSFVMSIRNGHFVSYHLNSKDEALCRLLYNKFRLEFIKILQSVDKPILSEEQLDQFMALQIKLDNGEITDESW